MSKLNEAEVREGAKKCIRMNPSHESADLLAHLLDLLDEKEKVIERLPKTADGVPVCPGDACLYAPDADGEVVEHCVAPAYMMTEGGEYEAWYIEERGGELHDRLRPTHDVYPNEVFYGRVEMFYSTREAAEAARNKETADDNN